MGRASRQRGLESREVWPLNVGAREVAAGRHLHGSFTAYQPHYVMGAECSAHVKDEKKSLPTT